MQDEDGPQADGPTIAHDVVVRAERSLHLFSHDSPSCSTGGDYGGEGSSLLRQSSSSSKSGMWVKEMRMGAASRIFWAFIASA